MKKSFTFIDICCGIGGFHAAAKPLGGECVFAADIDAYARRAYEANYGLLPAGDIVAVPSEAIPDHDALFAGFPCQPFSIIGKRRGFADTRGTLFFEIARILRDKQPAFALLENVKMFARHDGGRTLQTVLAALDDVGYRPFYKVLNALDFSLPQKRERIFIACFRKDILPEGAKFAFPEGSPARVRLAAFLEERPEEKHFVSPFIREKRRAAHNSAHKPAIWHENKSGNIASYPYSCALRAGASYNYLLVDGERRLTPREMLNLQGFPASFRIVCSDTQTRKQAGNAVPVAAVKAVLEAMTALTM